MKILLLITVLFSLTSYGQVKAKSKSPAKAVSENVITFDTTTVTKVSIAIGTPLSTRLKVFANGDVYYLPKYFCLNLTLCSTCRNYVGFKKLVY